MPAPLALSSSRGTGRLGLPESAGRGGRRCRGAARRAGSGPRPLLAPPGRRPALATNFNQVSCAGALAWLRAPACPPRPGPRSPGFSGPSRAGAGRRCWRRGFKQNAPSPLFAGPRWGCSRFPHSRSPGGPLLAQAATPPLPRRQESRARAQVEASGELGARRGVCALFGAGNPWCHPGFPGPGRGSGLLCPEEGGAQEEESLSSDGRRGDAL
ncbi:translation initiation factor IF-2-like [Neovison vison]|uniref:translation initiation factor IF-2-like n=1 Tax=Neovison vison TaxID=452646 RepID=UPI001CF02C8A|nr:translation initiation factor IF-2-like [Neogale vison]